MGPRQTSRLSPFLNTELPGSIASSQSLKSFIGDTRGSRNKLQQPQTLIIVKLLFNNYPEPLNYNMGIMISTPSDKESDKIK